MAAASDRSDLILPVLLLVLLVFVAFGRTLGQDFSIWDDSVTIYANPYLNPVTPANVAHFWTQPYEGLYIPLSYTVYAGITLLSQSSAVDALSQTHLDPLLYHLMNLLVHSANTLLVFSLLRSLVHRTWPAMAGACVFALHPFQVESVAWIPELRGLLCAFFCLLAIRWYLAFARGAQQALAGRAQYVHYGLALLAGVLAMLCKPTAISLPVLLFVLDRWCVGRSWPDCLRASSALLVPGLVITFLTRSAQPVAADVIVPGFQRLFVAGDALAFYLANLVAPVRLAIVYGRTPAEVLHHWWGYATWLLPAAAAIVIWLKRSAYPWLVPAGLLSLGALLPNLGLVPFGFQGYSTVADRYMYLAMLGPALATAFLLATASRSLIWIATSVVLSLYAALSINQIGYWDTSLTLWGRAVEVSHSNASYANYGLQQVANGLYAQSLDSFHQALHENPRNLDAQVGLATALLDSGKLSQAIAQFQIALRLEPQRAETHYKLGIALAETGKTQVALTQLREATQLQTDPKLKRSWQLALRKLEESLTAPAR